MPLCWCDVIRPSLAFRRSLLGVPNFVAAPDSTQEGCQLRGTSSTQQTLEVRLAGYSPEIAVLLGCLRGSQFKMKVAKASNSMGRIEVRGLVQTPDFPKIGGSAAMSVTSGLISGCIPERHPLIIGEDVIGGRLEYAGFVYCRRLMPPGCPEDHSRGPNCYWERRCEYHQEALRTRMQHKRCPSKLHRARGEKKARMLLRSLRSAQHD